MQHAAHNTSQAQVIGADGKVGYSSSRAGAAFAYHDGYTETTASMAQETERLLKWGQQDGGRGRTGDVQTGQMQSSASALGDE